MATLQEIQNHLNIEIGDKKIQPGRKNLNKNRYYRYDDCYIVELTQGKWMIVSNSNTVRRLLRLHSWSLNSDGYAKTEIYVDRKNRKSKRFHQLYFNYENGLVCDHINRCKFDNRFENLRIITQFQNCRNQSKRKNNLSGYTGICETMNGKGVAYFKVAITDNNKNELCKYFHIGNFGRDEALRLAIAQRQDWVQQFGYDHD